MSLAAPRPLVQAPLTAQQAECLFSTLEREQRLLVAVSGGPDSIALLGLLAAWAQVPGRPILHAATVDHGLREASSEEARAVSALCAGLGVPHAVLRWEGAKPRAGIQAHAREARYRLLADEAARLGGAVLVTAHHQDDQAETLLMRMAHGSGPAGLAGMRARHVRAGLAIARPLLDVSKGELVATAEALGLPFVRDPSNADDRFERARWRALLPARAREGLTAQRLASLARRLGRTEAALAHRAGVLLPALSLPSRLDGEARLRFADLLAEPEEMALRVVSLALEGLVCDDMSGPRLERLEACVGALLAAAAEGTALRRTLGGCVLSLSADGVLSLRREGMRRRGVHPAAS